MKVIQYVDGTKWIHIELPWSLKSIVIHSRILRNTTKKTAPFIRQIEVISMLECPFLLSEQVHGPIILQKCSLTHLFCLLNLTRWTKPVGQTTKKMKERSHDSSLQITVLTLLWVLLVDRCRFSRDQEPRMSWVYQEEEVEDRTWSEDLFLHLPPPARSLLPTLSRLPSLKT